MFLLIVIHYITHQCIWKYFSFQNLKEKLSKQEVLPTLDSLDVCSLRNDLLIFGVHCWTLAENLTNTDSLFCIVGDTYSHTLISQWLRAYPRTLRKFVNILHDGVIEFHFVPTLLEEFNVSPHLVWSYFYFSHVFPCGTRACLHIAVE